MAKENILTISTILFIGFISPKILMLAGLVYGTLVISEVFSILRLILTTRDSHDIVEIYPKIIHSEGSWVIFLENHRRLKAHNMVYAGILRWSLLGGSVRRYSTKQVFHLFFHIIAYRLVSHILGAPVHILRFLIFVYGCWGTGVTETLSRRSEAGARIARRIIVNGDTITLNNKGLPTLWRVIAESRLDPAELFTAVSKIQNLRTRAYAAESIDRVKTHFLRVGEQKIWHPSFSSKWIFGLTEGNPWIMASNRSYEPMLPGIARLMTKPTGAWGTNIVFGGEVSHSMTGLSLLDISLYSLELSTWAKPAEPGSLMEGIVNRITGGYTPTNVIMPFRDMCIDTSLGREFMLDLGIDVLGAPAGTPEEREFLRVAIRVESIMHGCGIGLEEATSWDDRPGGGTGIWS